jgi:hypothetical protein
MTAVATEEYKKTLYKISSIIDYMELCHYDEENKRYMDTHVFDDQTEADEFGNIMREKMAAYDTISVEISYRSVRIYLYE